MGKKLIESIAALLSATFKFIKKHWIAISVTIVVLFLLFKILGGQITDRIKFAAQSKPKQVEVIELSTQDVMKSFEFSGRVEAQYSVDLIARVQGFLQKSYFKEGDFVKKGQVLFLIEPSEYQIAVRNAQAALRSTQASLTNAEKNLKRAKELVKQDFVSKSYYDEALAARDLYRGNLDVNRAQLSQANLNLSYTKIVAPVDGKMGKILITQGNLVNLSKGTIAKLISTNPIYVTFTLKSEDYLKFKKADTTQDLSNTVVTVKLSDGSEYSQKGKVEFVDNAVDMSSGTITMRATFDNPDGLLLPSDFVTVYLNPINPRKEILAPMEAVQDSSDGLFVYVVNDNENQQMDNSFDEKLNRFIARKVLKVNPTSKKIVKKRIIKASEQYNNNWVVDEGLKEGDVIVIKGLTKIKDNTPIEIVSSSTYEDEK